jgi:hypothetical protein
MEKRSLVLSDGVAAAECRVVKMDDSQIHTSTWRPLAAFCDKRVPHLPNLTSNHGVYTVLQKMGLGCNFEEDCLAMNLHRRVEVLLFYGRIGSLEREMSFAIYCLVHMTLHGVQLMLGLPPAAVHLHGHGLWLMGATHFAPRHHTDEVFVADVPSMVGESHREYAHCATGGQNCQSQEQTRYQLELVATGDGPFSDCLCVLTNVVVVDTLGMLLRILVLALSVASVIVIVFCRTSLVDLGGFRVE